MRIRKNASRMERTERERYINALKDLKEDIVTSVNGEAVGRYDQFVALHLGVTERLVNGAPIGDGGHRGPAFLPWHRRYLLDLENALREIDSDMTIPYWDWTDLTRSRNIIFQNEFMGPAGAGSGPVGPVETGHFSRNEGWFLIDEIHRNFNNQPTRGDALLRRTTLPFVPRTPGDPIGFPTEQRMNQLMDRSVFEDQFGRRGFREDLEGDPHGTLHVWVGGTMAGMSSPNDPIFFLHHCNVDRVWAEWQLDGHMGADFYPADFPREGHALNDLMWPWDGGRADTPAFIRPYLDLYSAEVRPADVLNFLDIGFTYDTLLPELTDGDIVADLDLAEPGHEEGFRIVVSERGRYRIETHGETDTVMALYGPDTWVRVVEDDDSGAGGNALIVSDLNPGTYFVVVRHARSGGAGRFSISMTMEETQDDDPDVIGDTVTQLPVDGPPLQTDIRENGELDVYRFTVPERGRYTIETSGPTDVIMSLYGPDSRQSLVTRDDDSGQDFNAKIISRLTAGEYFVEVRHYFPTGTGPYALSVRSEAEDIPELTIDGEALEGDISRADESDLYQFTVTSQGTYRVETSGSTDTFLTLFGTDSQTEQIAQDDDSGPGLLSRIERNLSPGTYYARVRHYSPQETGPYGIRVTTGS